MSTTTPSNSDESPHSYSGLENADTNHATWFNPDEIDDDEDFASQTDWYKTHKQSYFKHLVIQHQGYGNNVRRNKPFDTFQANLHLAEILSGTLGLTVPQRNQAKAWFRRLDFQRLGVFSELTGYCICARLVHEDERDDRKCHPNTPRDEWPPEFRSMYEDFVEKDWVPTEESTLLNKAYGRVEHRMRSWNAGKAEPASEPMDRYGWEETHRYYDENGSFE